VVRSKTIIPTAVRSNNIRIMRMPSTAASVVAESSAQNSQIRVEMTTLFDVLNISAADSSRIEWAATQIVTFNIAGRISGMMIS
jgi:hypothetical protein